MLHFRFRDFARVLVGCSVQHAHRRLEFQQAQRCVSTSTNTVRGEAGWAAYEWETLDHQLTQCCRHSACCVAFTVDCANRKPIFTGSDVQRPGRQPVIWVSRWWPVSSQSFGWQGRLCEPGPHERWIWALWAHPKRHRCYVVQWRTAASRPLPHG